MFYATLQCGAQGRGLEAYAAWSAIRSVASCTVVIFSAPSSSRVMENSSSSAIMISTVSRLSAPRSTNLESATTVSRSEPSCSAMMLRTLSVTSADAAAQATMRRGCCAREARELDTLAETLRALHDITTDMMGVWVQVECSVSH